MTALPDPAELAPSRDAAEYGRRGLMSSGYWAMISFCVLCILAGMAIVRFGPSVFHIRGCAGPRGQAYCARAATQQPLGGGVPGPWRKREGRLGIG
ncbi:MAG TPA: hypothetical protein VII73_13310 [Caulobacteraceae bacterium]